MDISEQYIKMCEKAEEIQAVSPTLSDWDIDHNVSNVVPDWFISENGDWWLSADIMIWLPRQDQLQDMVIDPDFTDGSFIVSDLHYRFHEFYNDRYSDYPSLFASMEQLWLAHVMRKKYGKVWSEGEWILL